MATFIMKPIPKDPKFEHPREYHSEQSSKIVGSEVYHERRKQTGYLVGIKDLEEKLAEEIITNSRNIRII